MSDKPLSPTGIRMPQALRQRMREMAEANKRSLNAEIIFHLERIAFDAMGRAPVAMQPDKRDAS